MNSLEQSSDDELLALMAKEQHDAFDVFSVRYLQPLNRLVYRMGFQAEECEDMLQDILVHIWQKAQQWHKQDNISARSWVYRVATNLCIDELRKKKRRPQSAEVDTDLIQSSERSDVKAQNEERKARIKVALDKLPDRAKTALLLVYYQEMSNKEAADTMGVSVKAIEGLLVRGRKMLKKQMKHKEQWL